MQLVGHPAPDFVLSSTKNLDTLTEPVHLADYKGKWLALFFNPLDCTFVCPTERTGGLCPLDWPPGQKLLAVT